MKQNQPVFIHSLFRAGSTYIFKLFRESPAGYTAYQEPLHEVLIFAAKEPINLCHLTHTSPSLLLHPLDFLGCDDIKELSFFPAMDLEGKEKISLVSDIIKMYSDHFTIVPLGEHARILAQGKKLTSVIPDFRTTRDVPVTWNK